MMGCRSAACVAAQLLNAVANTVVGGTCLVLSALALSGHLTDTSRRENTLYGLFLALVAIPFLAQVGVVLCAQTRRSSFLMWVLAPLNLAMVACAGAVCIVAPSLDCILVAALGLFNLATLLMIGTTNPTD